MGAPQVHDFEPGIEPSGLFWPIPISRSAIDVDPGSGRARLHAEGVQVLDFVDFGSAVSGGTGTPSVVSFDVRWAGGGERQKIRDETFGFVGEYVSGPATISFSAALATTGAVLFESDPEGQSNDGLSGVPAVGHERNGVFFH